MQLPTSKIQLTLFQSWLTLPQAFTVRNSTPWPMAKTCVLFNNIPCDQTTSTMVPVFMNLQVLQLHFHLQENVQNYYLFIFFSNFLKFFLFLKTFIIFTHVQVKPVYKSTWHFQVKNQIFHHFL